MANNIETVEKKAGVGGSMALFAAYGLSCTVCQTGALIAQGSTFAIGFWGLLIGAFFWGLFTLGSGYVGHKTGQPKDIVWKNVFGRYGSKLVSFLVGIPLFFWGAYDSSIAAQAIGNLMPEGKFFLGFVITTILIVIVVVISGLRGIPGIEKVSIITVPVAIALFLAIIIGTINAAGGWAAIEATHQPETVVHNSVWSVAHLFVAGWAGGVVSVHDFGPGIKNVKALAAGTFTGGIVTCFCFAAGFFGYIATGELSIGNICLHLGGAIWIFGCLFTFVAQANTQPGTALFYCNSVSAAFKLPFRKVIIVGPILAGLGTVWIMYGGNGVATITSIITLAGVILSPIYGTVLSEFFLVGRGKIEIAEDETTLPFLRPAGLISVIVGIIIATVMSDHSYYALITVAVCAVLQLFLRKVLKMK